MDQTKEKWDFYIKFKISKPLGIDLDSITILDVFKISSDSNLPLKETTILRLENFKPLIYRELFEVSKKVEQALIMTFAELQIGIAYAASLASEKNLETVRIESEKNFISLHTKINGHYYERPLIHWSDKFGVVLFPAKSQAWDTEAAQENEPADVEKLETLFKQHYKKFRNIFIADEKLKKIQTASAILTTSLFDDSLINKIILSMTAIEVLSEKIMRPDNEIAVVDDLIKKMNDLDLNESVKTSIEKGMLSIKYQSISKSCKTLVKHLLGRKDAELFFKLYDFRSQLVHTGVINSDMDEMYEIHMDSFNLAKKLLLAYIEEVSKSSELS